MTRRNKKAMEFATPKKQQRSLGGTIGLFLLLATIGTFMAFPLVYAISSAFKPPEEFFLFPPPIFPNNPTIENFQQLGMVISNMWISFERYLFNSLLISVSSTLLYLVIATLAAYPLAKHEFPGKKGINELITLALMFTAAITAIPQYIILAYLGLVDNPLGVLLPTLASTMGVFLCVQYMEILPNAVLESGRMDGAGEWRIWSSIVVPNIRPVLFTMMIFQFQAVWNTTGANVLYNEAWKTLPAAMSQVATAGIARAGVGSAAAIILMIPPITVFIISQSNVMETMAHSGIKD
ncbi:MAG: carbohydrate ABC transporter permease, partial [Clostridia bacterium]|nr:carbohydrate ABC transporter permease [Clostridia bacterium]